MRAPVLDRLENRTSVLPARTKAMTEAMIELGNATCQTVGLEAESCSESL
jgi:hypothetical protein